MGMCTAAKGPALIGVSQSSRTSSSVMLRARRAPLEKLLRSQLFDHQNTNPLRGGGVDQRVDDVSNKLSRIHSFSSTRRTRVGVHHRRRADHREQSAAERSARSKRASYTGIEPVTATTSYSPNGARSNASRVSNRTRACGTARRFAARAAVETPAWISIECVDAPSRLKHARIDSLCRCRPRARCPRSHAQRLQDAALYFGREHRLTEPDGKRRIGERELAIIGRHEGFARYRRQRIEHSRIENLPGADLLIHHLPTSGQRIHDFSVPIWPLIMVNFYRLRHACALFFLVTMIRDASNPGGAPNAQRRWNVSLSRSDVDFVFRRSLVLDLSCSWPWVSACFSRGSGGRSAR